MSKTRHNKNLPIKQDPAEFGGGRYRGYYTNAEIQALLCSRAGCGRNAFASWGACADDNVLRPMCPECDYTINEIALRWMGDPDATAKLAVYRARIEEMIGRPLSPPAVIGGY